MCIHIKITYWYTSIISNYRHKCRPCVLRQSSTVCFSFTVPHNSNSFSYISMQKRKACEINFWYSKSDQCDYTYIFTNQTSLNLLFSGCTFKTKNLHYLSIQLFILKTSSNTFFRVDDERWTANALFTDYLLKLNPSFTEKDRLTPTDISQICSKTAAWHFPHTFQHPLCSFTNFLNPFCSYPSTSPKNAYF